MNILVGMSGGVDSSTAALMLKEQGHKVIGVTMAIYRGKLIQLQVTSAEELVTVRTRKKILRQQEIFAIKSE